MVFTSGGSKGSSDSGDKSGKQPPKRSIGQIIDFLAKWAVLIVGLPIRVAAAIVAQFVANGGAGRAVVGGLLFMLGSAISADSIWQTVFRQRPVFPWFGAVRSN
jgi:hypothetical protein